MKDKALKIFNIFIFDYQEELENHFLTTNDTYGRYWFSARNIQQDK